MGTNTNMNNSNNNSSNNNSTTAPRPRLLSFYPNVKFHEGKFLGGGPYSCHTRCYRICDYCKEYKQMYILDQPIYYENGARRRLVSYCVDCKNAGFKAPWRLIMVDELDGAYYEILDAIRDSSSSGANNKVGSVAAISFEDAVTRAYNRTENISYNGSGAEPGVSMLKRYLGCHRVKDNNISFDDTRLWEFRYKLQHEEPRVKVVSCNDGSDSDSDNTLLLTWNREYVEDVY